MRKVNDFNSIASSYDLLASIIFGKTLTKAPQVFLSKIPAANSILVVGGGTGAILIPLIKSFPDASIHYFEPSDIMISKAKTRVSSLGNQVNFQQQPLSAIRNYAQNFDLMFTPFVLDLFSPRELKASMEILYCALLPNGNWIQSDFYVNENSLFWQRILMKTMHHFFRITASLESKQLQEFHRYFEEYSLKTIDSQDLYFGMIKTIWYQKLLMNPNTTAPLAK